MPSDPQLGFPFDLDRVPPAIVGADGWADPVAMKEAVFEALARTVGAVAPIGKGSFDVFVWHDVDVAGRRSTIAAGEWKTGFVATPAAALDCLAAAGLDAAEAAAHAERKLRVRYTNVRRSGIARPGRVRLLVSAYARPGPGPDGQPVVLPARIQCLASDFFAELEP